MKDAKGHGSNKRGAANDNVFTFKRPVAVPHAGVQSVNTRDRGGGHGSNYIHPDVRYMCIGNKPDAHGWPVQAKIGRVYTGATAAGLSPKAARLNKLRLAKLAKDPSRLRRT
jgi:hypothetical protein